MCSKSLQGETDTKVPGNLKLSLKLQTSKSGSPDAHFTWNRLSVREVFQDRGCNIKGEGRKKGISEREQQRQCLYSLVGVAAGLC